MCIRTDTTPNVDYFTREEIRAMVKEFKDRMNADNLSDVIMPATAILIFILGGLLSQQSSRHQHGQIIRRGHEQTQVILSNEAAPDLHRPRNRAQRECRLFSHRQQRDPVYYLDDCQLCA